MRRLLFPHLALWVLGAALVRIVLIPPEVCPDVGTDEVTDAAVAARIQDFRGVWISTAPTNAQIGLPCGPQEALSAGLA